MAARSVQISLDEQLLKAVDQEPEAKAHGRSAVVRRALRVYLRLKRQGAIDRAYAQAYAGKSKEIFDEFSDLLGAQVWPEE